MTWWKRSLFDTCSLITLDKLLLERPNLVRHFPTSILALKESFTSDQLRAETAERMRQRVTHCPLPPLAELGGTSLPAALSLALAKVDKLVHATAVHYGHPVVTADKHLAKSLRRKGLRVGNVAMILKELVVAKKLTVKECERLLVGLARRKDLILGSLTPSWRHLREYSFPS